MEVFASDFTDGITEGFKTAAPYVDVTDSPIEMSTKSPRDSKKSAPYGDESGSPMTNADGITEGFKTAAPYGDVPCLSSD